jgi:RNA polymerase sigma-B factor
MRFFQDLKQTQIGAELGYSQMHVSRVLRRALAQLREQLAPSPPPGGYWPGWDRLALASS